MLGLQAGFVPVAKEAVAAAGRLTARATPREQAHVAALAPGSMARSTGRFRSGTGILHRPPARRAGLPAAPFLLLLAGPAGGDAGRGRGRRCRAGAPSCRAMAASWPAAASPMRKPATTWWPRPPAAPPSSSTPATSGRRMPSRMCWRCRAAAARASPGSPGWSRTGTAATTSSTTCGGTAPCTTWSGASSTQVLSLYDRGFRDLASPAHPGAARPLHRRAERRLHAVPAGAARRRCRRPLGGAGRQGGGADRRLPVGLHPAALDDGAGRDRALGRGAAHAGRHARLRRAATHGTNAPLVAPLRAAGGEAVLRARAGRPCRRGRGDAAGARATCISSAAATRSRTCWSSSSSMRR